MNALTTTWSMIRAALDHDRKRQKGRTKVDEHEFLPAALEVIERPVSPTSRITARALLCGVAALGLWLTFGRTDVVASAPGRIVPAGAVKLVQPAETGVVRRILVRDGDHVAKGQPLVMLDPTMSSAELAQAEQALETASFEAARTRAVIDALDGKPLSIAAPAGADPTVLASQQALAEARLAEVRADISLQAAQAEVASADIASARAQTAKLDESLPILDQQIAAYESLLAKGFVSKLKVLDMRRQRIAQVRDRDAAIEGIRRATAQSGSVGMATAKARLDARAALFDQLVKAEGEVRLRREELEKSRQRATFQVLRAPVAGTVGQLAVHTEGGVVEAAKPIMSIVPDGGRLIVEVMLLNRDAGFVARGQDVAVKLDAFPFARYGTIPGRVVGISPDAVEDEKLGLVYVARIALDRTAIDRDGTRVPVGPGMSATADIVTGNRSFLSYLVSPIDEIRGTALRER